MATGPIETHLHRSFNWENGAPGARMGPRGRSASCGSEPSAQCVRLRSEINPKNFFQKFLQKLSIPASPALLLCYIGRGELPLGLRYV